MSKSQPDHELPEYVLRALRVLERYSGQVPLWRAVVYIVATGSLLTALVTWAVWQADRQRDQQDLLSLVSQVNGQVQDRLNHRRWMLSRVATDWSETGRQPGAGMGFAEGDLWLLTAEDGPVNRLGERWTLSLQSRQRLAEFWRDTALEMAPYDQAALSPPLRDERGQTFWMLVHAMEAGGRGGQGRAWAVARVVPSHLLGEGAVHPAWNLQLRVVEPVGHALADPLFQWVSWWHTDARVEAELRSAEGRIRLVAEGQPVAISWQDSVSRQSGLWIAGGFGVLFTLGALHAYLLLISTRLRARDMARQTTVALQRSESRTRAVVDTAPDAILTASDDGRVLWCNQATLSIFGRDLDSLRDQSLGLVIPALEGVQLVQWFNDHGFAQRVIGFETLGRRVEGTEFPIAISARRVEVDGDCINTIIVRDTTDAKWAERELLLRERALASSAEGIVIVDMTLPGQPMIFVNTAFERITGYEMHDILGQNCRILQGSDRDQPGIEMMRRAIEQGEACQVVVRNYRRDGSMFWNELTISPVRNIDEQVTHYVGVASDITDRMAAEQVLHLRTERLNAVFELSPDGFVVLDKRGEVSIVNPAFERMTGLCAADLVGQTRDAFEEHLMSLCSSAVEVQDGSAPSPGGGGDDDSQQGLSRRELLHLHSPAARTLVRRVRHGGHDNETVMYFRDITQELEVDRMKSEFLSIAAHELRTPMASIYGFTELLLKRKFDDARRADMLSTIHKQAHILINLINELLDLARIEARRGKDFKRKVQPLAPLLQDTVAGLLMHNDDRKVAMSLPAAAVWVDADTEKLAQAVTNVLSNAYKYSPQGGSIVLDVVSRQRGEVNECGIRVQDQGLGMSPEHLARLFERFFRADTSGNIPGTGLGMTIVKEIIELHGGEVAVDSALGQGTTVVLWLPTVGAPEDAELTSEMTVSL